MDENMEIGEEQQNATSSLEENEGCSPENGTEEVVESTRSVEGDEPLGKFKSAKDLLNAYNSLQAEFTRKSQKLAELEKEKMQTTNETDELFEFLSKNHDAVAYADELKNRVESDQSLQGDKKAYEKAWANLLYEKLTSTKRTEEPIVQNFIQDSEIQDLVIKNYYKQLRQQKTPTIISSGSGQTLTQPNCEKPSSMEEAKKVALKLFEN